MLPTVDWTLKQQKIDYGDGVSGDFGFFSPSDGTSLKKDKLSYLFLSVPAAA